MRNRAVMMKKGGAQDAFSRGAQMADNVDVLLVKKKPRRAAGKKVQSRSRLLKYVDRLAEELRVSLASAFEGDVEAIHDARVATRRLKAVVDLFDIHLSKRLKQRFNKSLKRIRRMLGDIRDLDVMIGHVDAARGLDAQSRDFLLGGLKREREDELSAMSGLRASKILGKLGSWWGLREQIRDDHAMALLRESLRAQLARFCQQADLHSGVQAAGAAAPLASPLNPHELRIAGKALRYTLEMAVEEGAKIPAPVLRQFKRMQDMLGLWHDHVVLAGKTLELCLDAKLNYTQPALLKKGLAFSQACIRRSEARLRGFVVLWKKQGVALQAQIQVVLGEPAPSTEPVGEVETAQIINL